MLGKKIFLHVGAPKTATTFIQRNLKRNEKHLKDFYNLDLLLPEDIRGTDFLKYYIAIQFKTKNSISFCEAKKSLVSLLGSKTGDILISEESLSHDLMPRALHGGGFSSMNVIAELLFSFFKEDVKILLTIRNQAQFIESSYLHKVHRWGWCIEFPEYFFKHINLEDLSWLSVAEKFKSYFGSGNVNVLPFELLKISEDVYFREFLSCVSGAVRNDSNLYVEKDISEMNLSLSEKALRVAIELNKKNGRVAEEEIDHVIAMYPSSVYKKPKLLTYNWKKVVFNYYQQSNRELLSATNYQMKSVADFYYL